MTRKKSLWAIKMVLHASHHPPTPPPPHPHPLHDISGYNSAYNWHNFVIGAVCQSGGEKLIRFWFQYSLSWGWDPKDDADHGGYQGSCVAYPFMAASPTTPSLASCIIWITGEEAFLECVATGSWGGNSGRTSVGYWGFGLWDLESPDYPCLVTAEPIRTQLAPTGVLGQPE